jgi:hypothetical protein
VAWIECQHELTGKRGPRFQDLTIPTDGVTGITRRLIRV